jgi:predicted TIM-barrel fold metal-dependent hydrolase
MLPGGAMMPYGQRFYRPIHEACADRGLILCLHSGGEGLGVNPAPTPAGFPSYYAESVLARLPPLQVHLASFVFEGVFTTHPDLRVAVMDAGFAWVPPYLWYMDQSWEALRSQTPWIDRHPSEIVLEHFAFTTRPAEPAVPDDAAADIMRWMKADRTLMFASDYPRWDWAAPGDLPSPFADTLRERVLGGNAADFFRR